MEISIVILNYKMKGLVKNCLRAILESDLPEPYEIIVVDNNSRDGIEQMMEEEFPQVKFIQSDKNAGMGAGNNLGIKAASGKYVLILNPDIFVYPESIRKLHEHIRERADIGLLAPKLVNADRSLQLTCYRWHGLLTPIYRRTLFGRLPSGQKDLARFLMMEWDHEQTQEVDWIQGSCIVIPKRVLDEVGLFDEQFFMYFEDTDLCRRINKAGYKNVYFPETEVIHMHRRQSADGGFFNVLFNKMTRVHLISWWKYLRKWSE